MTTALLINALILLAVLVVVLYVVKYGIELLEGPPVLVRIVGLILVLVWLLYVLRGLGVILP
jgi:hypothetical protein